jgi:hypothetical protein
MTTIRLEGAMSAEPNTCGSCKLFHRGDNYDGTSGHCCYEAPPILQRRDWDGEGARPSRTMDQRSCSEWRPSGDTYERLQTWTIE